MKLNKLLFSLLLFCILPRLLQGQPYGNEWIDYTKTYYKIKVSTDGIYHINKSVLDAAGIPAGTKASNLIMYKNGTEVPLFTTTNDVLGAGDYIAFFGQRNDGSFDRYFYDGSFLQVANPNMSMVNDTSVYFLTYDNNENHLRFQNANNTITGTSVSIAYCWATAINNYKNNFSRGKSYSGSREANLFTSQFDGGEGYVSELTYGAWASAYTISTPNIVNNNEFVTVDLSAVSQSFINSQIVDYIKVNGIDLAENLTLEKVLKVSNANRIRANQLNSSGNNIIFQTPNTGVTYQTDLYGISYISIEYPRNLNMNGLTTFKFRLRAGQEYLELSNINASSSKLYDITNNKYYNAIVEGGVHKYFTQNTNTTREFVLITDEANNNAINAITGKTFTNTSEAGRQGNYIMVTTKQMMTPLDGVNYINEYKNYRSSAAGGGYVATVVDADDLYDEYAYGNYMHPLAIKNFLRHAYNTWSNTKPEYVYFIGKGLSLDLFPAYFSNPSSFRYQPLPTYGYPGSDLEYVNFSSDLKSRLKVARLSAWDTKDLKDYFNKVKAYEAALAGTPVPTNETELWKKTVLHVAGGNDVNLQQGILVPTLNQGKAIIESTSYGANVSTIFKNTTAPVDLVSSRRIDSLINNGLSIITFHGHASASGFDFNLNAPDQYQSMPRVPLFLALGCDVSQIFLNLATKSISENYIFSNTGGSIAMLAANSNHFTNFHNFYLKAFYDKVSKAEFGKTLGAQYVAAYDSVLAAYPASSNSHKFFFAHAESMLLQGDPAIRLFGAEKPDFHVNAQNIATIPAIVNTSLDSFTIRVTAFNLAKAITGNVKLKIEHHSPSGTTLTVALQDISNLYFSDTLFVKVPVNPLKDIGLNRYTISIDADDQYEEISEANNTAQINVFIYSESLVPIYPYDFSIVYNQGVELKASTLNPFIANGRYKMEIDTTELFNSPFKQSVNLNGRGGIIKWTPAITMKDSTVYYWRTAMDSAVNSEYQWGNSSFIYLANGSSGWNQSHYFQYQKDKGVELQIKDNRDFEFDKMYTKLTIRNKILTRDEEIGYTEIDINDGRVQRFSCILDNSLQVMVIDSATGKPWINNRGSSNPPYSGDPCRTNTRDYYMYSFHLGTQQSREYARKFIVDSIPNGNYILIRNSYYTFFNAPLDVDEWLNDTLVYGSGNSLYHALKNEGFTFIDSIHSPRVFSFFKRKGRTDFEIYQEISRGDTSVLYKEILIPTNGIQGSFLSTTIGPASEWTSLLWRTSSKDADPGNDSSYVKIIGIDAQNAETLLYTGTERDKSLNTIDAGTHPRIRLEWYAQDTTSRTAPQLDYWRVLYKPLPEAALNPAAHLSYNDTVSAGQKAHFSVAVENISDYPMDSMLVKYTISDANGTTHNLNAIRYKKLDVGDTLHAHIEYSPDRYIGNNVLFIEANPDNDQPEQYHPNNIGFIDLNVKGDYENPIVDVTFDGVHILDKDIVSAKPFIKILLKDENKYVAMDDSSLVNLYIKYPTDPHGTKRRIPFDGTTCKFIPAVIDSKGKNEAYIEYRPNYTEDSTYLLFVSGTDKAGNYTGNTSKDYQIAFNVFTKSTITNVLNYPNPFSTSTAFVFTLTGSQVPSQFKIQIMTVTGKVVREITKPELGTIRIGRNMTEYKWDGKDQYGQLLGNGVYLYRVVTSINGTDVERRESGADKYFKAGFSKMYIMR